MEKLFESLLEELTGGRACALCSVIGRSGSVAAPAGSRLLVRMDGTTTGTVGGGALEGEVIHDARNALCTGRASVREFDFTGARAGESLQICGGKISIYIEIIQPVDAEIGLFAAMLVELRAGRGVALVSRVDDDYEASLAPGRRMLFGKAGVLAGSLEHEDWNGRLIESAMPLFDNPDPLLLTAAGDPQYTGRRRFLVDFFHPAPVLVVFGGGHIGKPLAHLGALTGFRVVVVDDRIEFSEPQRFPEADQVLCSDYGPAFDRLDIGPRHYLVSVTRCHTTDKQVISRAINTDAAYIGMIGSRRKVSLLWQELEEEGVSREQLNRVHAPVGVSIEAETPEEIAVSIIAQVISVRRGRRPTIHAGTLSLDGAAP